MATLVFSALGTLFGGPLGGAIGALVGRQVDAAIIGSPSREGPRLKDMSVSTSSYGTAIPKHFGRMRVAGSIIWSTDLVEHSERSGGGKGKPSVTTYSYSASFAVALASRPLRSVGRIWADGNLLRGAAGDLKANGQFRFYSGEHDQPADPLIMAAEGAELCPAFRGLAYAVFEDLDLSDFFNRIPTLTFEVVGDDGEIMLQSLLQGDLEAVQADVSLGALSGLSLESTYADGLAMLARVMPLDCDMSGADLTLSASTFLRPAIALGAPAMTPDKDGFARKTGVARKRAAFAAPPPEVLRYYDVERDYQPGVQRTPGRGRTGQPQTIELPAALTAPQARQLADDMARRAMWRAETMGWRSAELDAAVVPGATVSLPLVDGLWRVTEWEWNETGVEMVLERLPQGNALSAPPASDPGRINPPRDLSAAPTVLAALELPWDGSGSGQAPLLYAAASAASDGWTGAALYADNGDGQLQALGSTGQRRAVVGQAEQALAGIGPHLFDRHGTVTVQLAASDLVHSNASTAQLAQGANRALLGSEILQFSRAESLGAGRWRLSGFLRGRGGSESAAWDHAAGERFVLLDDSLTVIDPSLVGTGEATTILALGRGDAEPVASAIALRGATMRPLSPVHPYAMLAADGSLHLRWTRRARGAWTWLNEVETPLHEHSESYQVTYGSTGAPMAVWDVGEPQLILAAQTLTDLAALPSAKAFHVRQRGNYSLSPPCFLIELV